MYYSQHGMGPLFQALFSSYHQTPDGPDQESCVDVAVVHEVQLLFGKTRSETNRP